MSDADVKWLRSREPFASMDIKSFPKATPIEGILKNDCRLHRCEPGEIIVREGDYGSSAFVVLAGSVELLVQSLSAEILGRAEQPRRSWRQSLSQFLRISNVNEARSPEQVTLASENGNGPIRQVDDRTAIFLQDVDAILTANESVTLGPGELFGEVAAMYRTPRSATVIANQEATLLEIRWQGLRILRRDRDFCDALDQHYRTQWLPIHLRELPLLRHVPEVNFKRVVEATELRSFGRMEWNADYKRARTLPVEQQILSEPLVSSEGRLPTELIIVRSGFGRISMEYGAGHRTIAYVGKSQTFGLEEVAYNALRESSLPPQMMRHSLRAIGFLDTLNIPSECFGAEVLPYVRRSELPGSLAELATTRPRASAKTVVHAERRQGPRDSARPTKDWSDLPSATGTQFQPTGLLEFIVQNRFNNGREAMVIDLHRCTRCDDCVTACAATHGGNPRFVRQGAVHERLQFVQACMHCTDPVCMIGCPTGAISREAVSGVVSIHEPICVGCGVCASSCPYQNIRMAEVFDHQGRPYVDASSGRAIAKATKCDSCASSPTGPACQAACPHDALMRIDLSESKPLSDWLERRE
jgi:Fe-S-cluster-containing dehydrogenase component/CRP-like cAMP-binding protein